MSIVIVSKTRMRGGRVCVGAHDLDGFQSLRLYRHDGAYLHEEDNVEVGQIWDLTYRPKSGIEQPHVEDVIVEREGAALAGRQERLATLIRERDVVWRTPDELFEGCLRFSSGGSAYVPVEGSLPSRSTGYWVPQASLQRHEFESAVRYRWTGGGSLRSIRYVGVAEAVETIEAGTMLRVSLSRRFAPSPNADGYWLQLSGWY